MIWLHRRKKNLPWLDQGTLHPDFSNMKRSYLYAAGLSVAIALWMASGMLADASGVAPDEAEEGNQAFPVETRWFTTEMYEQKLRIRARIEALRSVSISTQLEGTVEMALKEKGEYVKKGDLICGLYEGSIPYRLAEAESLTRQRQLELQAAEALHAKGNRSETQLAQAQTAFETAKAQVADWTVQLSFTKLRAPFDALVAERPAEQGQLLRVGDICARLIDVDPFLAIGEVSEAEVALLSVTMPAQVRMQNGVLHSGRIRYISPTATERTRTFRVEIEIAEAAPSFREGLSADVSIPLAPARAHRIPSAILVLDTSGRLGVRAVDQDRIVRFYPITLLNDPGDSLWVSGLPDRVQLITAGQDFVLDGEPVRLLEEGGA